MCQLLAQIPMESQIVRHKGNAALSWMGACLVH